MSIKEVELGDLIKVLSGFAFDSSHFNTEAGMPLVRIRDVVRGYSKTLYNGQYDERFVVTKGDILVGMDGEFNIAEWRRDSALLNQRVCKLEVLRNDLLDSRYLLKFLPKELKNIEDKASFVTVKHLSVKDILGIKIPLPSLSVQNHISKILDDADNLRKKDQALLKSYDELAQSIFYDMFGDPVRNEKGWPVKKLKDIAIKVHSGNTPKGGSNVYVDSGITFFRSQNVWKNNLIYEDIAFIDEKTHKSMSKSSLKHNDILMTKTGRINTENSSLGRAALFQGKDDSANVNGHVYLIRLREQEIHEFVVHILTSESFRDIIREVCVGGIDKRQLNKDHIEDFNIIYPPLEEQKKFSEILRLVNAKKAACERSRAHSEDLFNSLLQKAFKGELIS